MFDSAGAIRGSLEKLGALLDRRELPQVTVLVCGGSALNLSGLLTRTTADVDALGIAAGEAALEPLPEWLCECADETARETGMERGWLNDAASVLQKVGLPEGILRRSNRERFGRSLEVAVASRVDLIALKCFAALDPRSSQRHLSDLVDLAPGADELAFAAEWLLDRPTSPQFRKALADLRSVLGHPAPNSSAP
jgi:hypothetical protein